MEIDALKICLKNQELSVRKAKLNAGPRDMEAIKTGEHPLVYIVYERDLDQLRMLKGVIEDRGKKHKAKGLSNLLLGREKIPVIDGGFSSAGRLISSVKTLLNNAKADSNIYIIGVVDHVFNDLCIMEEKGTGLPAKSKATRRDRADRAKEVQIRSLMKLIGCEPVPPKLKEAYIGESIEAELVRQLILRASQIDDPVLILGDTGTGKEVVAREIHHYSKRKGHRFVTVNCGAISPELFEGELFGHKRGAFTSAVIDRKGLWREADGGTLFLDEIGDLSLPHQVKILRALQEGTVRPVGEEREYKVSARIIAATNRDLLSMVQSGQFREDLYYRLRCFLIETPELKNHLEDVPRLTTAIWEDITKNKCQPLSQKILDELQSYRWPGNVRELKMVLIHLYGLFRKANRMQVNHLNFVFQKRGYEQYASPSGRGAKTKKGYCNSLESMQHLRRVYEVIRAAEVTIAPLIAERKTDKKVITGVDSALQLRLDELDRLCLYPLRFYDQQTFDEVNSLKSKLLFFKSLLKENPKSALQHWKENAADEFSLAMSSVLDEIEKVMKVGSS